MSSARGSRLLRGGQLHLLGNGASEGCGGGTSSSSSSARTTRGLRLLASTPASRSKTIMTGGGVNSARITGVRDKSTAAAGAQKKVLNADNVYENLVKMEYAVRGPLLIRALEIEKELQKVGL